jgi:hypothetical protein
MNFRELAVVSCSLAMLAACASNPPAEPPQPVQSVQPAPVAENPVALPAPAVEALAAPVDALALPPAAAVAPSAAGGTLEGYLADLRAASCPPGARRIEPEAISLVAKPVALQAINPSRKAVGELMFVGGFHLTSSNPRFGGLSGLDVLDNGNLLAVSDEGEVVWIDLDKDGVRPIAARIAGMRDAAGNTLQGKADGDSEGLAVNGGMALVSFERNHRVLAYDIGACGAAARGAPLTINGRSSAMPQGFNAARISVSENQGPEPLGVTRDWYLFTGLETKPGNGGPLSARPIEAPFDFSLRVGEGVPDFVGLDVLEVNDRPRADVRAYSLHRSSSSPLAGNAITVMETYFDRYLDQSNLPARLISDIDERSHYRFRENGRRRLAELNFLFNIDNFEGIAARQMPDGRVRLYLISDNNFAERQRTLLYVFDIVRR